jgi:phosphatidylinositol alpha-mannosyltransferase
MAPILPLCVLEFSNAVNVGTFHASYSHQHLYRLTHPIIKRWYRRLDGGIAVSPAAHRYVNNSFPADYRIIPNGVDVDHFTRNSVPWPEYQDGKTNILFVGRLEKRKGLKYLLEAFSRLKWDMPNIRLLVVGPGNLDKDSHRILGARGLQDVVFAGRISSKDLARYYATAHIFCSPATGAESFGIVLLEAMAAGKPVIASDIEGYRGTVSHGQQGLLFAPKDSEELARALTLLVANPELAQRMGARGHRMVQQYRWDVVASQVEDYYDYCLKAADGRARKRAV